MSIPLNLPAKTSKSSQMWTAECVNLRFQSAWLNSLNTITQDFDKATAKSYAKKTHNAIPKDDILMEQSCLDKMKLVQNTHDISIDTVNELMPIHVLSACA
jgi:hypothetical protein